MTNDGIAGCSGSESVTRHPSPVVFDSDLIGDYCALKAEMAFEDVLVHMLEPLIHDDLLPEERGGREAEDREVHPTLSTEPVT